MAPKGAMLFFFGYRQKKWRAKVERKPFALLTGDVLIFFERKIALNDMIGVTTENDI